MPAQLDDLIQTFRSVDPETRLELLLDYSRKLPALPEHLQAARDAGLNRIHECMTPVFLFIERSNGHVQIHADVAEEAPTVKGFISVLIHGLQGASAAEVEKIPIDLADQLKLTDVLRMNRSVGLAAIVARVKREAAGSPT